MVFFTLGLYPRPAARLTSVRQASRSKADYGRLCFDCRRQRIDRCRNRFGFGSNCPDSQFAGVPDTVLRSPLVRLAACSTLDRIQARQKIKTCDRKLDVTRPTTVRFGALCSNCTLPSTEEMRPSYIFVSRQLPHGLAMVTRLPTLSLANAEQFSGRLEEALALVFVLSRAFDFSRFAY